MNPDQKHRLVLNFHGIGDPWEGVPSEEVPYWCPAGMWPHIADALAEVQRMDGARIGITFDDGNLSDIEEALPVLLDRGLEATFFVCAARIGRPNYLAGSHLVALRDAGMRLGSHGWGHVDLRRTDPEGLRRESRESRRVIEDASGGGIDRFAIPFGSYDRRVLSSLKHYREVHTSDGGTSSHVEWLVPRNTWIRGQSPEDLIGMVRARPSRVARMRRRARTWVKSIR